MNNLFKNKSYINHLKLLGLLLTILFMCLLTYGLMWNPYRLYFDRPELSSIPYDKRELFAGLTALTNFLILLGMTFFSVFKFWKQKKFVVWAPIIAVATLLLLLRMNDFYPDSQSEYTKDGFQYLEQHWYLDNENTFKRFKSEKPLNKYSDHRTIVWQLDSIQR